MHRIRRPQANFANTILSPSSDFPLEYNEFQIGFKYIEKLLTQHIQLISINTNKP